MMNKKMFAPKNVAARSDTSPKPESAVVLQTSAHSTNSIYPQHFLHSSYSTKALKAYAVAVVVLSLLLSAGVAMASGNVGGDAAQVINNLSEFVFTLIRAIGLILLGFGVVQFGLSLKSHDPSQRANAFLTIAGGIVITFAKEILDLITGGLV